MLIRLHGKIYNATHVVGWAFNDRARTIPPAGSGRTLEVFFTDGGSFELNAGPAAVALVTQLVAALGPVVDVSP